MSQRQPSFFEDQRSTLRDAIELTRQSLLAYGPAYRRWAFAYSGGKDGSATLTICLWLILTGQVPAPESIQVLYADTRLELPPLHVGALQMLAHVRSLGISTHIVEPPIDHRFYTYMFGRGVPPPHSGFRWCTGILKIDPMAEILRSLRAQSDDKPLLITGMRLGESAARDQRITLACSKNDGECGQGWYQQTTPAEVADTLAPLLHWRVCHIGDWLMFEAPRHGWPTGGVVEAYGAGDGDSEPLEARTGCLVCPVAGTDRVLERTIRKPEWAYMAPLLKLRALYDELSSPPFRLRQNGERKKNGQLSNRPMRTGPLTMDARRYGLGRVLEIQHEVNQAAFLRGRPLVSLINHEEHRRILELIEANTWPDGWTGGEPRADQLLDQVMKTGAVQPVLAGLEEMLQ